MKKKMKATGKSARITGLPKLEACHWHQLIRAMVIFSQKPTSAALHGQPYDFDVGLFFIFSQDANLAGTKDSEQCTLILTEGDSRKA